MRSDARIKNGMFMTKQEAKEIWELKRTHPLIGYNVSLPAKTGKQARRYLEIRPASETHFALNWTNLKEIPLSKVNTSYEREAALFFVLSCRKFGEFVNLWACCECCPKEILLALKDVSTGYCEAHYAQLKEQALQKNEMLQDM
jgi:hypothetical protein